MNQRRPFFLSLCLLLLVFAGCSTTHYNVTIENQLGDQIYHRNLVNKDLDRVLADQYTLLASGQYEKCMAMGMVVARVWPSEAEATEDSLRLEAWATLFLYQWKSPDPTRSPLENERKNLLILKKASSEFSSVKGKWEDEADVVKRAIQKRLIQRSAFNAFVDAMKTSTAHLSGDDGGLNDRKQAIEAFIQSNPNWSRSVGIEQLENYPWRRVD